MTSARTVSISSGAGPRQDLIRNSTTGIISFPRMQALGKSRFGWHAFSSEGNTKRDWSLGVKVRKKKKIPRPWPDDPDPNVKGGVLFHLSHFKPFTEKPKPMVLNFETPLLTLEKKIAEVKKKAKESDRDLTDVISMLEEKYQQALKNTYSRLTPIQRVHIARHPQRPTFLDYVFNITEKFVELHGDRAGYDDPAVVTGIGTIDGKRYMFMGHQKGRNTKENIMRNFAMPTPHGYRKALRMMYYADHHGFPIITFIDTPGAFADLKCEHLGQGEAIARNLRTMFGLKVPIICIVIGEGGSGGALAIGCGNKLLMLENAVFYVASPEACATILWKNVKFAPKAARKLRITAHELCKLKIADGIIREPLGGAHKDPEWTSLQIKNAINMSMEELLPMETEEILEHRMMKFRKIGGFQEGIPIGPEKKFNMKGPSNFEKTSVIELEAEVEKLKVAVSESQESSNKPIELPLSNMIEKLRKEVNLELSDAFDMLRFDERLSSVEEEIFKARVNKKAVPPNMVDRIDQIKEKMKQELPGIPNYASLKGKLGMLEELIEAKSMSEKNKMLKVVLQSYGLDNEFYGSDDGILTSEAAKRDRNLVPSLKSELKMLMEQMEKKIHDLMQSSDYKEMVQQLKLELLLAGASPNSAMKKKINAMDEKIRHWFLEALSTSELKKKYDALAASLSDASNIANTDPFEVDLVAEHALT